MSWQEDWDTHQRIWLISRNLLFAPHFFYILNMKYFFFFSRISNALLDTFITLEETIRSNWYQRECLEDIGTVVFHSGANLIFDTSFLYFKLPCHDAKNVFECLQSANSYWILCKIKLRPLKWMMLSLFVKFWFCLLWSHVTLIA